MYPESDIAILTQELVRRESRDDPTNYKANVVREKEEANKEKPNHPSAETVVKQVLAVRVSRERRRRSRAREPKLLQLRRDLDAMSLEAGTAVNGKAEDAG